MCACTEPVRTGIGAVCVEYGRPKWPITMLNHTNIPGTEWCVFFFLTPCARTTRYEETLLPKGKKRPHYKVWDNSTWTIDRMLRPCRTAAFCIWYQVVYSYSSRKKGESGPLFSKSHHRPAISLAASNACCRLFRISVWKTFDTLLFPLNQFLTRVVRKMYRSQYHTINSIASLVCEIK